MKNQYVTTMALLSPKVSKTEDNVKIIPGVTKQGKVYLRFEADNFNGYIYLTDEMIARLKELSDATDRVYMS